MKFVYLYFSFSLASTTYFSSSAIWVRFSGSAGTTIVNSATAINRCDTQATG